VSAVRRVLLQHPNQRMSCNSRLANGFQSYCSNGSCTNAYKWKAITWVCRCKCDVPASRVLFSVLGVTRGRPSAVSLKDASHGFDISHNSLSPSCGVNPE
jgi:hypothetical protein